MKFYDLKISKGDDKLEDIVSFAEKLGYSGICLVDTVDKIEGIKNEAKNIKTKINIIYGAIIISESVPEMRKLINKVRESVEVVIVHGGKYEINRAACENSKVDILLHPEKGRRDNGLDETCLKLAKEKNVAIGIDFRDILVSYKRSRSSLMEKIMINIHLCKNLDVPVCIVSGAQGKWDMRDPRELVSIMHVLGTEITDSFSCVSKIPEKIIETNKKKLLGEIVSEGVEIG